MGGRFLVELFGSYFIYLVLKHLLLGFHSLLYQVGSHLLPDAEILVVFVFLLYLHELIFFHIKLGCLYLIDEKNEKTLHQNVKIFQF